MTLWYMRNDNEFKRRISNCETSREALAEAGEGWQVLFPLDREPSDFETVDEETGQFILDIIGLDVMLHQKIDEEISKLRQEFIPNIFGQDSLYAEKATQARTWQSGANPEDFLLLTDDAEINGISIEEAAAAIIERVSSWEKVRRFSEKERRRAKIAVSNAETEADKRSAAFINRENAYGLNQDASQISSVETKNDVEKG